MQKGKISKIIAITTFVGAIATLRTIPVGATTVTTDGITRAAVTKGQVVNVTSTLRIRSAASTSSSVLGTISNGTVFEIVSKSGNWYQIKYNGTTGYVHGDYVKEITESTAVSSTGKVYNVQSNLRVRSGASTNSSVLGYLTNNAQVTIVGSEGSWYKIKYNSGYGYVHKDYILIDGNSNNSSGNDSSSSNDNNSNEGNTSGSTDTELNKTGYVYNVSSGLRVRKEPSTNSTVLGTLYSGNKVNIIGESGSWYKINYNNSTAYVHKDYITENEPSSGNNSGNTESGNNSSGDSSNDNNSSGNTSNDVVIGTGTIINVSTNLRVRQTPSTSGLVLGYVLNNQSVEILAKENNWYKIKFNGSSGYVSADYVRLSTESNDGNNNTGSGSNDTSVSDAYNIILSAMNAQVGSPYVYGGSGEVLTIDSLTVLKGRFPSYAEAGKYDHAEQYVGQGYRAFDCSGLMQWGFKQANITIGRTTYDQINNGIEVAISDAKAGDLLFTDNLGHVAMYLGNDQWIESPKPGEFVRVKTVQWSRVQRVRRIL